MNYYIEVLKKYAVFEGRARRKEYWMFALINIIISIIITIVEGQNGTIGMVYSLLVLIPGIAVGVRRMHDVGKSGWYLLIPIYNLILALTDGEPGSNKYGANPKEDNGLNVEDHIVEN